MSTDAPRYAVYFAPRCDSDWWNFGCRWLGRDPVSGLALAHPAVPGVTPRQLSELTGEPRRYGFHATLKPPFRLAPGRSEDELHAAVAVLASTHSAFSLGPVDARVLGSFIALQPRDAPAELQLLAQACVEYLDPLRALPAAAEFARRRAAALTMRQDQLLERWGYPFVLDEWRFHMTLTRSVSHAEAAPLLKWLQPRTERLNAQPMPVDALCVYVQSDASAAFRLVRRLGFDGSVTDYSSGAVSLSAQG